MEEDIYIRFLRQYYKEHGTINDIPFKYIVEFEGQRLCVYEFLKNIRNRHRAYIGTGRDMSGSHSKLSLSRYKALDEMNYDWNGNTLKTAKDVIDEPEIHFLRKHYAETGTMNDIPYGTEVVFENKTLKIGSYLKSLREHHAYYNKGKDTRHANSEIYVARYKILDEMGFDWEPNKRLLLKQTNNDICLKYLQEHFKEKKTINDITSKDVVEYEGKTIEIGRFLEHSRVNYRKYLAGNTIDSCASPVMLERYEALNKMGFIWEPNAHKSDPHGDNDPYIAYLRKYYEKYGTINDIKTGFVAKFNGETLNIGDFLGKIRYSYSRYQAGDISRNYASKLLLRRYAILKELQFDFVKERPVTMKELALENGLSVTSFTKLCRKFDGNVDKALKIALLEQKIDSKKEKQEKEHYTLDNLLAEFDIDFDSLLNYLNRTNLRTSNKNEPVIQYQNMTLSEFCLQNGYNYDVLYRALKLKKKGLSDEDLTALINRSIIELNSKGQGRPFTWVYSKYGNEALLKHILLFTGFDSRSILNDMSQNAITLDEAFVNASFRKKSGSQYRYLEGVYLDYIDFYHRLLEEDDENSYEELLIAKASDLVSHYSLTQDEFTVIREAFFHYTSAVHKFHLCDVGFEKDNDRRVEKIINYRFDEDDIEEAFFIPLKFDERVLIGKNSELYKRRALLRNLTTSWNSLSEEERIVKTIKFNLSEEEMHYVNSTCETIEKTKEMVHKRQ